MENNFNKVKNYLLDLEYNVVSEDTAEELVVVEKEEVGIKNLILDCEDSILVVELLLFEISSDNLAMFKEFLMMNRNIIHGAIALDESGTKVIFRDTLQLENLDLNEIQATLNSLEVFLSENATKLINFAN
jgi:hypothetical protein